MSAPVDVLAVLDAVRRDYEVLLPEQAPLIQGLSVVVAELIEASRDYRDCLTVHAWSATPQSRRAELMARYTPPQGMRPMRETERRFNAALANVEAQP